MFEYNQLSTHGVECDSPVAMKKMKATVLKVCHLCVHLILAVLMRSHWRDIQTYILQYSTKDKHCTMQRHAHNHADEEGGKEK